MKWKTFNDEIPDYDKLFFVYKTNGIYNFFNVGDDIRRCKLISKTESSSGWRYHLEGYDYGSNKSDTFTEKEFMKMKWMEIPKP